MLGAYTEVEIFKLQGTFFKSWRTGNICKLGFPTVPLLSILGRNGEGLKTATSPADFHFYWKLTAEASANVSLTLSYRQWFWLSFLRKVNYTGHSCSVQHWENKDSVQEIPGEENSRLFGCFLPAAAVSSNNLPILSPSLSSKLRSGTAQRKAVISFSASCKA